MTGKDFRLIITEINAHARKHPLSKFRQIRKDLKRLTRLPPKDIFTTRTTFENGYAFHDGGRKEIQFNIGVEHGNNLRHGIAFSLEINQTLPSIDMFIPKIKRFNEYIQLYSEKYADMRMWHYIKDKRSSDYMPTSISPELVRNGIFIFLGKQQNLSQLNYTLILDDLYRLLPLYHYVESGKPTTPVPSLLNAPFAFSPRPIKIKKSATVASLAERELNINLRHNILQEALCQKLAKQYGAENVDYETSTGKGTNIDVVVRQKNEYWFYEIKTSMSPRICIREAIGQLLEYALWPTSQTATRLIIVGESALDQEGTQYLCTLKQRFSLPVEYEQIVLSGA